MLTVTQQIEILFIISDMLTYPLSVQEFMLAINILCFQKTSKRDKTFLIYHVLGLVIHSYNFFGSFLSFLARSCNTRKTAEKRLVYHWCFPKLRYLLGVICLNMHSNELFQAYSLIFLSFKETNNAWLLPDYQQQIMSARIQAVFANKFGKCLYLSSVLLLKLCSSSGG